MDVRGAKKALKEFTARLRQSPDEKLRNLPIYPISAKSKEGVEPILNTLRISVQRAKSA